MAQINQNQSHTCNTANTVQQFATLWSANQLCVILKRLYVTV